LDFRNEMTVGKSTSLDFTTSTDKYFYKWLELTDLLHQIPRREFSAIEAQGVYIGWRRPRVHRDPGAY